MSITVYVIKIKIYTMEDIPFQEDFELFIGLEFLSRCPIASKYKGIKLLGDKIRMHVANNEMAQNLAYMALGTGVVEMNARDFGFANYRWL